MDHILSIGGIGGSGTRVVAEIFAKIGFFMGYDTNESNDTLLYTLLFKREDILTCSDDELCYCWAIYKKIMQTSTPLSSEEIGYLEKLTITNRVQHDKEWLHKRLDFISHREVHTLWGWKEPNTHIVIERLLSMQANLKFIYVYRNGLDMAYSSNQNQLKFWGKYFLPAENCSITPKNSLKYWCITHKKIQRLQTIFADRIYMLDFDQLCTDTAYTLEKLQEFVEYEGSMEQFKNMVKKPASSGRYKQHDLAEFDAEDLAFVSTVYEI